MKKIIFITAIVAAGIGLFFGWLLFSNDENASNSGLSVRQGGYDFINPLLECEIDGGLESKNLTEFKSKVQEKTESLIQKNPINHISVYYRDLNNGPWFGINEKEQFAPASLLKVPTMIAYLKAAEQDPSILTTPLNELTMAINKGDINITETATDLINKMIVDSDNEAFENLVFAIGSDAITQVHNDLGIEVADKNTASNFISVKTYASLFRVLYNASYLNREMSEKALGILSQAAFNDGLAAGIPADINVANKYGITGSYESGDRQLHDCGIIYYPNNPYLLCIMTRGNNSQELAAVIAEISSLVYQQTDNK